MSQQHGYLLRSVTAHNKLLKDKGLAETIKKLSPLNEYPGRFTSDEIDKFILALCTG